MVAAGKPARAESGIFVMGRRRKVLLAGTALMVAPAFAVMAFGSAQAADLNNFAQTFNHNSGTLTRDVGSNTPFFGFGGVINNNGGTWNGTVKSNAGTINNNATWSGNVNGGLFGNIGIINNNKTWTGTVGSSSAPNIGTIHNYGTWNGDAYNAGTVTNSGTWVTKSAGFNNDPFGTLITTGTLDATHGGLTNGGTVYASGVVKGAIVNQGHGAFDVIGNLTGNGTFLNTGDAVLNVTHGNFTGITTLTNYSDVNIGKGYTLGVNAAVNGYGGYIEDAGRFQVSTTLTNTGLVDVTHTGSLSAGGIFNQHGGQIVNSGWVTAGGIVNTTGGDIRNYGGIQAGGIYNGFGGTISNHGGIEAGYLTNGFGGEIYNHGGIAAFDLTNQGGFLYNGGYGVVAAYDLTNKWGGTIVNNGQVFAGDLTNKQGGQIYNGGWITAGGIVNTTGGEIHNYGGIQAGGIYNGFGGTISNHGGIEAGYLTNGFGGEIYNHGGIAAFDLTNQGGFLYNSGHGVVAAYDLTNKWGGTIINDGRVFAGDLTNKQGGFIYNGGFIAAGDLTNKQDSAIVNGYGGTIVAGDLTNKQGGFIYNGGTVAAYDLTNKWGGTIVNDGRVFAGDLTNKQNSAIVNDYGGKIVAGDLTNKQGGFIYNDGTVKAYDLTNKWGGTIVNDGRVFAGDLTNKQGGFIYNGGFIAAGDLTNKQNSAIVNGYGGWLAAGSIYNGYGGEIYNSFGGVITAGNVYNGFGGTIVNNGVVFDSLTNAGFVANNGYYNADVRNFGAIVNSGYWDGNLHNAGLVALTNRSVWQGTVWNGGAVDVYGRATVIGNFHNYGYVDLGGGPFPTANRLVVDGKFTAGGYSDINVVSNLSTVPGAAGKLISYGNSGTTYVDVNRQAGSVVVLGGPTEVIKNADKAPGSGTLDAIGYGNGLGSFGLVNVSLQNMGNGNWDLVRSLNTGAAAAPGANVIGALTALDAAFQPSSPFVASPHDQNPDTWTGGVWSRVGGGQMTTKSTASDSLGSPSAAMRVKTTFDAYQVGVDTGGLNFGGTGWNGHFGVMGGDMTATSSEQLSGTSAKVDVPFAGIYGVLVNGPWSMNLAARYDWLNTNVTDAAANLTNTPLDGHSFNVTGEGRYHVALANQWFVEPTAGLTWTQTQLGSLATNANQTGQGIAAGSINYGTLTSVLAHGGVRVGTTVQAMDNLFLQPFGTFSVWHEFGDNFNATFAQQGGLADIISVDRVGTFYQAGIGVAAQLRNTGFTGFARGDFQFGDKVDGAGVVGGLRYNFGP